MIYRKIKITWTKNMSIKGKINIKPHKSSDFTSVTFYPDLKKFKLQNLTKDFVSLLKKRVNIYFNLIFLGIRFSRNTLPQGQNIFEWKENRCFGIL